MSVLEHFRKKQLNTKESQEFYFIEDLRLFSASKLEEIEILPFILNEGQSFNNVLTKKSYPLTLNSAGKIDEESISQILNDEGYTNISRITPYYIAESLTLRKAFKKGTFPIKDKETNKELISIELIQQLTQEFREKIKNAKDIPEGEEIQILF